MNTEKNPILGHSWAITGSPLKFAWGLNLQCRNTYHSLMLKVSVAREHNNLDWYPIAQRIDPLISWFKKYLS